VFKRIDTVFLPVKNTASAIKWYEDKCSFRLRWHHEEGGYAAMDIGDGETAFTLVRQEQMEDQKPVKHEWFNLYTPDAKTAHEQLVVAGVEVTDIMKDETVEFFNFKDLDGNIIGVCSFKE
jgi:catechol 2,3-dioxygenase-like lactoylglutathione lyase family enzyme